jgi:LysR family transcriptional regulator, transcriptional activator for bauABCD operon
MADNSWRQQVSEMDLRLLRVFKAVADSGGFTAAEVILGKSKSAISTDITDLESRLQMRLCRRGRSGFALTPEGERIREAFDELQADLDHFRDKVNRTRQMLSGALTVYITDNIVTHDHSPLVGALSRFVRQNPGVSINFTSAPANEVEQSLLSGRAHVGVSLISRLVPTLETIPLFKETGLLYCGRRHPLFSLPDDRMTPDVVRGHRIVGGAVMSEAALSERIQRDFESSATSNTIDARIILLLTGEFLGFLPPPYAASWVERGEIRPILTHELQATNIFYAIFNRSVPTSLVVDKFRRILLEEYGVLTPEGRDKSNFIQANP